ncbi:MAG: hypothetical protein ACRCVT_05630 [Leadbetterella sp.]
MKKILLSSLFVLSTCILVAQSYTITPNRVQLDNGTNADNLRITSLNDYIGITSFRYNGTTAAKTAVVSNNILLNLSGGGYTSPSNTVIDRSSLQLLASQNWTSTAQGTRMEFRTTLNGGTIPDLNLSLLDNGTLAIHGTKALEMGYGVSGKEINAGKIIYNGFGTNALSIVGAGTSTANRKIYMFAEGGTVMDGKLGVGIDQNTKNLHVHQPTASTTTLKLSNTNTGDGATDGLELSIGTSGLFGTPASIISQESGFFSLGAGGTAQMILQSDGKVGIGSLSLGPKLQIHHSTANDDALPHLGLKSTDASNGMIKMESSGTNFFGQYFNASSATPSANFISFDYNGTQPILDLQGNGNVGVTGFTKLGNDASAPSIKMKKFTGTTSATQGGTITIAHGVTDAKILSVRIMVNYNSNASVPDGFNKDNGFECNTYISAGSIYIENKTGNSGSILSKPFTALIVYEN